MAAPYRGRQQHVVPMTVEEKESLGTGNVDQFLTLIRGS